MKCLLFLAALTLLCPQLVLALERPDAIELEVEQPQILDQQQLEEYQRQGNEQIRQFNTDAQESLNQTYANKAKWEGILGEIHDRQIESERDRNARPPRIPTRFLQ